MNFLLIRHAAIVPLLFLYINSAYSSDNGNLAIFAKANVDKYQSEILETKGLSVGSTVTVTGRFPRSQFFKASYDDEKGEMFFNVDNPITSFTISETCKSSGSYQAQNSFGAKTRVTQKICNSIQISEGLVPERGNKYVSLLGKRIEMTPTQYREIKDKGLSVEMTFVIEKPKNGFVVRSLNFSKEATIRDPNEILFRGVYVNGHVTGVKFVLPGSKELVTIVEPN